MAQMWQYADKCMLDDFLDIHRQDYVVAFDENRKRKLVDEICKNISDL